MTVTQSTDILLDKSRIPTSIKRLINRIDIVRASHFDVFEQTLLPEKSSNIFFFFWLRCSCQHIKVFNIAMEMQQFVPFALLWNIRKYRTVVNNIMILALVTR
jgi:hypothetical protein